MEDLVNRNISDFQPITQITKLKLGKIPKAWASKIELFYPDLPQFPLIYIHFFLESKRIYGFPIVSNFTEANTKEYELEVTFLSNIEVDQYISEKIINELKNRFGFSDPLTKNDLIESCKGNKLYEEFYISLWPKVEKIFGNKLQYGRFYEDFYSIVRFVAAWAPRTGRQSEMRMLYWFLNFFGQKIKIELNGYPFYDFFILPCFEEIFEEKIPFQKFKILRDGILKVSDNLYTDSFEVKGIKFPSIPEGMSKNWKNSGAFREYVTDKLFNLGVISNEEEEALNNLVDAFNRHPGRAFYFISAILHSNIKNFHDWDKDFFIEYYCKNKKSIGISEKVIACSLQQGFGHSEMIPIDTWVDCFHRFPLGIDDQEEFFNNFSKLGKIERLIWQISQAKKINNALFNDCFWCLRFGTHGNTRLRENNPISCGTCVLKNSCPGYKKIENLNILLMDDEFEMSEENFKIEKSDVQYMAKNHINREIFTEFPSFIVSMKENIPRKVYKINPKNKNYFLIDEWSTNNLRRNETIEIQEKIVSVKNFVSSFPEFLEYWNQEV